MSEKFIGYMLLTLGLGIMFYSLANVYGLATNRVNSFEIFRFDAVSLDFGQIAQNQLVLPAELQQFGVKANNNSSSNQEILPSSLLNTTSNVFIHIIIMGFVASIGFKTASLGVSLVRPIVVKQPNLKNIDPKVN